MKTILERPQWESALARYRGATAQIWFFQVSLKRLLIRLSVDGWKEELFITAVGCEHIVASFSWRNASIVIDHSAKMKLIADQQAGFELVCTDVALALTVDEDMTEVWFKDGGPNIWQKPGK